MKRLLDRLERYLGPLAVPHLTEGVILCQALIYFAAVAKPELDLLRRLELLPVKVLEGEVWRLFTFAVVPPFTHLIFMIFGWYLFYLMGTALEQFWGTFRFNLFLTIGYVATVAAAFVNEDVVASNAFLGGSVFLAFAFLFPDFVMYIFFLLPVKIKWLALVTWIIYGFTVLFGGWEERLMILASVCNFLFFFAPDIYSRLRFARRQMAAQAGMYAQQQRTHHRCTVCGITDRSHPRMEFRYCSTCEGNHAYCTEHLRTHEHITAATATEKSQDGRQ